MMINIDVINNGNIDDDDFSNILQPKLVCQKTNSIQFVRMEYFEAVQRCRKTPHGYTNRLPRSNRSHVAAHLRLPFNLFQLMVRSAAGDMELCGCYHAEIF